MILTILILIVSTLLGGFSAHIIPGFKKNRRAPLIFAGAYLFSITIIHIIPELFATGANPSRIGLYILIGFFLQQFLEYFSSGVEHGHIPIQKAVSSRGGWVLITALTVHSLLEGMLLTHDSPFHGKHESFSLLIGIVLHKAPAAFALMTAMQGLGKRAGYLLLLFSIASPIGLLLSEVTVLSETTIFVVFAIVCGSFLHISTTIFVEASPHHHFRLNTILISIAGALLAIFIEYLG